MLIILKQKNEHELRQQYSFDMTYPAFIKFCHTNFNSYSNTTLRHRNMVNFRRRKSNMSEVFISLRLGRSGF